MVGPVAGVAEELQWESVRGSGSHGSASWVEEAGYMLGFFPNSVDPIPPTSLETLPEEDPEVVAALFHVTWPSLAIVAAEEG